MMTATTGESEQLSLSHRCPSCLQPGCSACQTVLCRPLHTMPVISMAHTQSRGV